MVEVDVGGERHAAAHLAVVVGRLDLRREFVEGLDGGEGALDDVEGDAVVGDLEESDGGGGAGDLVGEDGFGGGEVDDGD